MEPPYSYLQVDIQEHPTPIEFPPPFSIEEFNLYHHHAYPPHMNYDKNALYMNHLSLSGSMFPNGASRSGTHKSKSHHSKQQQQQQQQQQQHQQQQHHPSPHHPQQQHHQQQQQQPHPQHPPQHQPHPAQQQPQLPSPAPAHHHPSHNPGTMKDEKVDAFNKAAQPAAVSTPGGSSSTDSSSRSCHSPTVPEESIKNLSVKQLVRAKHTLQQRIKRQNETEEQKALRRQRNAELNRKRRQNKEDIRVTIEKTKNRLRQRIKREIDRMLRTRQKRDDFLRETFEQMATVFADEDMLQYQERVATVLWEISKGTGAAEGSTTNTTDRRGS